MKLHDTWKDVLIAALIGLVVAIAILAVAIHAANLWYKYYGS